MTISCAECGHDFEIIDIENIVCPQCGAVVSNEDEHLPELSDKLSELNFDLDDIIPINDNSTIHNNEIKSDNNDNIITEKINNDYFNDLAEISTYSSVSAGSKSEINSFFSTPAWFFLAVFTFLINIVLLGIIFWQRLQIDVIVNKLIGEG